MLDYRICELLLNNPGITNSDLGARLNRGLKTPLSRNAVVARRAECLLWIIERNIRVGPDGTLKNTCEPDVSIAHGQAMSDWFHKELISDPSQRDVELLMKLLKDPNVFRDAGLEHLTRVNGTRARIKIIKKDLKAQGFYVPGQHKAAGATAAANVNTGIPVRRNNTAPSGPIRNR